MSGIGVGGVILLVLIALLLFGPNKLPELGRAVGRTLKEFKAGANEMIDSNDKKKKRLHPSRLKRFNKQIVQTSGYQIKLARFFLAFTS